MGKPTGGFERTDRLLRPRQFERVVRSRRRAVAGSFEILMAARVKCELGGGPRLGITVSRRVGGAVVRNCVKRRIREWFRHERGLLKANLDIVVVARPGAARASQRETTRMLSEGVQAAGMLR